MNPSSPIRFEQGRPMLLAGIRRHHPYEHAARDIPAQWRELAQLLPLPGQCGDVTYGVLCGHDAGRFEYLCGAEVASLDALPASLGRMKVQPQQYAVFLHSGAITGIRATWENAFSWLAGSAWQSAQRPDFERYDHRYDPASKSGEVEIWISVIPK